MKLQTTKIAGISTKELKNGDISYYGSYRDPITKKPTRKKLGTKLKDNIRTPKQALIILNSHIESLKSYTPIPNIIPNNKNITLDELANLYFTSKINRKRRILKEQFNYLSNEDFDNSQVVKAQLYNTKKEGNRYKKNVSKFKISKVPINKINRTHINHYIEFDLTETSLSQKSKFNVISLIKTIINYGIKEDIIFISNPFKNIKFKNPQRQRERVLSISELDILLKTCKAYKNNRNVYLSVYLAVLTGGRANTILNIKKKDIDIQNKSISLNNFKANRKYIITITDKATKWLKDKILPYYESNEFIIRPVNEFNRSNPPVALSAIPNTVYKIMDQLFNQELDKHNNDDRDKVVNFHTIRRSVATNLAKSGTPLYDVMIFLNHSNIEQTMKYLNMQSNNLNKQVDSLMEDIFKDF